MESWLDLHKPFPKVVDRLKALQTEDIEITVLTTKGKSFTAQLLTHLHFKPNKLFGHESGSKAEVLLSLIQDHRIQGLIEDRRSTLETLLKIPALASIPYYLADWGYLKPQDKQSLPPQIHLLTKETLATPLATWH